MKKVKKMNKTVKRITVIVSSIAVIIGIVKFGEVYRVYEANRVVAQEMKEEKESAETIQNLEKMNKEANEKYIKDNMKVFNGKRNIARDKMYFEEIEVGMDADHIDLSIWGEANTAYDLNSNLFTVTKPQHMDYYDDVYFEWLEMCDYPYQTVHQVLVLNGKVFEVVKSVEQNVEKDLNDLEYKDMYKYCDRPL